MNKLTPDELRQIHENLINGEQTETELCLELVRQLLNLHYQHKMAQSILVTLFDESSKCKCKKWAKIEWKKNFHSSQS